MVMNNLTGIEKWRAADGDNTYALDWPLNEDSHVWEIGGFEGRWAQQIWDKFHCNITIFEPQYWLSAPGGKLHQRFAGIDKIVIKPYGLMEPPLKEWETHIIGGYETDGAGLYSKQPPFKGVSFRSIHSELGEFPSSIDLALMNIEGMEYELIPFLVSSGLISNFEYFWCQFHPGNSLPFDMRGVEIYALLDRTHDLLWDFYPTAVAWKRR